MRVLIVEPFFSGSHASWAEGYRKHSRHEVEVISLPGRHWKWRMHGGAVALSGQFKALGYQPDLILATDMLDLPVFLALCGPFAAGIPTAVYFHENQLSYPWSPDDRDADNGRDFHYGFINWTSALAADRVFFNSKYNLESFYEGVRTMLKAMPDARGLDLIARAEKKSEVLSLGIDLTKLKTRAEDQPAGSPVILWNHRWEYDKDPEMFFRVIRALKEAAIDFRLIVCGKAYGNYPPVFDAAREEFDQHIIHWGYAQSAEEYRDLLSLATILPVTSRQEFFGQSVIEAIYAGCLPLLPNALAYPEHVPESLRSAIMYRDEQQLTGKVMDSCRGMTALKPIIEALRGVAAGYDWSIQKDIYDDRFEQMTKLPGTIN